MLCRYYFANSRTYNLDRGLYKCYDTSIKFLCIIHTYLHRNMVDNQYCILHISSRKCPYIHQLSIKNHRMNLIKETLRKRLSCTKYFVRKLKIILLKILLFPKQQELNLNINFNILNIVLISFVKLVEIVTVIEFAL